MSRFVNNVYCVEIRHDDEQVKSNLSTEKVARLRYHSQNKSESWQRDFGASAAS